MDSGTVATKVKGMETVEPVFGLPALWIKSQDKEKTELNGYTVIDPESVFITHLSETLKRHAHELLSREDVQLLVDRLRRMQPSLVGEALAADGPVSVGLLQRVLKNLLKNQIPIRELTTIIETLSEYATKSKNPTVLTEMVRKALARTITDCLKDDNARIPAITLEATTEHQMLNTLKQEAETITLALPAQITMELSRKIAQAWRSAMDKGKDKVALLCDSRLRAALAEMLSRTVPSLPVAAYDEIILGTEVEPLETVSTEQSQFAVPNSHQLVGAVQ
jgi:flagellar biosynthesis protein FlhA